MYGPRGSAVARTALAVIAATGVVLLVVIAYHAGVTQHATPAGAAGGYGWGWHRGAWGGPWFLVPLFFGVVFFVLLFGLVRAALFGFGPRPYGDWRSERRDAMRRGFDEWHREAHTGAPTATPPPPGPTSGAESRDERPGGER